MRRYRSSIRVRRLRAASRTFKPERPIRASGVTLWDGASDSIEGALISAAFMMATSLMLGGFSASAGVIGVVATLTTVAMASTAGFFSIMFQKLIYAWFIGATAASLAPDAAQVAQGGAFITEGLLVIPIERCQAEKDLAAGKGPVGFNPKQIAFDYRLYRFQNMEESDPEKGVYMAIPSLPDGSDARNAERPPTGRRHFIVPLFKLRPGDNYFRVITYQLMGQGKPLIEGASTYAPDGRLSKEAFISNNLRPGAKFDELDKNHDGILDDNEFRVQSILNNPAGDAFGPTPPECQPGFFRSPFRTTQRLISRASKPRGSNTRI